MLKRRKKDATSTEFQSKKVITYHSSRSRAGQNTGRRQSRDDSSPKRPSAVVWIKSWLPSVTLVIIVSCLLSLLVLGGEPRVRIIQSEGGIVRHDTLEYDSGIQAIWSDSINNLTKITAKTTDAETSIKKMYPELDIVRVELPFIGRRPLVTIVPALPAATLVNPTGAYYVSHQGELLSPADDDFNYTGSQPLISITDQSGLEPKPGEYVLTTHQVAAIRTYVNGLEENKVQVERVILPPEPNRVDVVLRDEKFIINFSLSEDPRQGIGAYLAVADTFVDKEKPQDYVDVRVPEKVFYK